MHFSSTNISISIKMEIRIYLFISYGHDGILLMDDNTENE